MTTMPTLATDAIATLDRHLAPSSTTPGATAGLHRADVPVHAEHLIDSVRALEDYAGVALAAPVKSYASNVVAAWRGTIGNLEATSHRADALANRNAALEAVAHGARSALVDLGEQYIARDRAALEFEFLANELEEVIASIPEPRPGSPATEPLSHRRARALIREAHKRAAKALDELIAEELAQADAEAARAAAEPF